MIDWNKYTDENKGFIDTAIFMEDLMVNFEPQKILEVGCNVGNNMKYLANKVECHGIDSNQYAIQEGEELNPHIYFKLGSALNLPYNDKSFDIVFCSGLLCHLRTDLAKQAIAEMLRVTKELVIIMEYMGNDEEIAWREGSYFIRHYEKLIEELKGYILMKGPLPKLQNKDMEVIICKKLFS